jgi:septum formation protein
MTIDGIDCSATPVDLILASASPRRSELLQQIGVRFAVVVSEIDETPFADEIPEHYVCRLASAKAKAVSRLSRVDGTLPILGADTIVVCDDQLLGKPGDGADAERMLRLLSGRVHEVLTAVCVTCGSREELRLSRTAVRFRHISASEITAYWLSGEPAGKAGAYAVQGLGAVFIEHIEGSYTGVVGLPLFETAELLRAYGVPTLLDREVLP